jgi:Immunity protein 22
MATVHVFATSGRFSSFEQLHEFIDPTYTGDGELVPSRFISEVELDEYEPACIEAIHTSVPKALPDLLCQVSYGQQWLHLVDRSVVASEAICVFEPNRVIRPSKSSMQYCGAYQYVVPVVG